VIVRRERPDPGAQLSLFDTIEGMRHQVFITDGPRGSKGVLTSQHDRLTMDTVTGLDRIDIACVLNQLAAPISIPDQIHSTAVGLQGTDDWGDYQVTWIVEAGRNLNVTITEN